MSRRKNILIAGVGASALVAVIVAGLGGEGPPPAATAQVDRAEAERMLGDLHGTWIPRKRELIFESAMPHMTRLEPRIEDILVTPDSVLFREAVCLAVHQKRRHLAPLIRAAIPAVEPDLQSELVHAAEELRPWTESELEALLRNESAAVVIAALEVIQLRDRRPGATVIELLLHSDHRVRAAALSAVPNELTEAEALEIVGRAEYATGSIARECILALAHAPVVPRVDRFLYDCVEFRERSQCIAALETFGTRRLELRDPDAVYRVIRDAERPVLARAAAILCLERTRTFAQVTELEDIWPTHPVLEHFAGRALIAAGRKSGIHKVLEVLEGDSDAFYDVPPVVEVEVKLDARRLIAKLSRTGPFTDRSTWRAWADGARQRPCVLGLPAVQLR